MTRLHLQQNQILQAQNLIRQIFILSDTISPRIYVLKASILNEKNQKKEALKLLTKAIAMTNKPHENWLIFATSLHIEMKHYPEALKLLTQLVASYPDKQKHWNQLHAVDLYLENRKNALAVMDLTYKLNYLKSKNNIFQFTQLLREQGQPLKAARIMQASIPSQHLKGSHKHYEALGNYWQEAEEIPPALKAFKQATAFAKNGVVFKHIGQIYFDQGRWQQAIQNFQSAIHKGKVKDPEQLHILIGIAYMNSKHHQKAIQSFEHVTSGTKTKERWIKEARSWIQYVNNN